MDKRSFSERDICTKFITPALQRAGWDEILQIREEVGFAKGCIIVRGKLVTHGQAKRADYILYYKPNIPLALIEAKDNTHSVGDGMQQAVRVDFYEIDGRPRFGEITFYPDAGRGKFDPPEYNQILGDLWPLRRN